MRIKSTCLVCQGRGRRKIDGVDHQCLGCRGYGWLFVNTVKEKEIELPDVYESRKTLHLRARSSGLTEKIINAITDYQKEYLANMDIMQLRPMRLLDIGVVVGCDPATVHLNLKNREINGIPVKELFSEAVDGRSNKVVMAILKNLIQTPATHQQYVDQLAAMGVKVARRTVTKYIKKINEKH